jgi:hypothetical protein
VVAPSDLWRLSRLGMTGGPWSVQIASSMHLVQRPALRRIFLFSSAANLFEAKVNRDPARLGSNSRNGQTGCSHTRFISQRSNPCASTTTPIVCIVQLQQEQPCRKAVCATRSGPWYHAFAPCAGAESCTV